ncbi:pyridoxal phosphate-dependent aminotransferase [Petralouisia muris]|uniref:Pyridoxal phosphate-dependent aminotransferase n=1 Tax=Petralouisia muris TaxID=3032872 RepID=A0AC61RYZ0_9FIRM|nr:pyridoxal phosphate-dependent aminotransferase [Petralouisia muris]TGY97125.1 pyridoxal phosphate-dependent aminotransferase [Petralouisia muris]
MISKQMQQEIAGSSAIRAMFLEGKEMAKQVGAENVYDFSLGNPMTPVPEQYNQAIIDAVRTENSLELHGYMDNAGYLETRQAVAENLNQRFGTEFEGSHIVMTVGAAGALNVVFKTILDPGDEVLALAPYFGEYRGYVANHQGILREVKPDTATFQPDLEDLQAKITPRTKGLIINNPVNPTGVIYSEATIQNIASILEEKQKEYGHEIYLVSDEPYRELVYDGNTVPFLTKYYDNTFVTYSFSKSLSIPGERIGYIAVSPCMADCSQAVQGLSVANRILGFVNAPSLMQKALVKSMDARTDVDYYDRNRRLIYGKLTELGFTCVKPQGAFYLFIQSPEPEEKKFVEAAKKHHILLVGGSSFSCPGYVRLAYCVSYEMIERSLPAFEKLAEEYRRN